MRATLPVLGALMLLAGAATPAHAIVPCLREHGIENEFVDEDTRDRGRMRYRAVINEVATGAPQFETDGSLVLLDVVSGERLAITWEAVAGSKPLAHAAYLAAVDAALFRAGGSASGIALRRVEVRGRAELAPDDLLRFLSLVASSYGVSGGPEYVGAILDVAGELRITLPDLMQRQR